jgi:outer membrane protein TolC
MQAANKQKAIAAGKYLPVATFDIGYYTRNTDYTDRQETFSGSIDRDQENKYMMAGVTLSWNLFDGGRAYYENQKYSIEAQKFNALIIDARNTISTGIRKALYSMSEAEQRLASSANALIAANENYTSEVKRLNAGISTIQTLLEAQGRLVRTEANKTTAMLDYQLAQSELKLMTGGENIMPINE